MITPELARALTERFGTPLFAYDLDEVDSRCDDLRRLIPAGARLFYSLKANPLPAIAVAARAAGCRGEVSSIGELAVALKACYAPEGLLYTGPGKVDAELEAALACGVGTVSAESWRDLERISAAASIMGRTARTLLRVNPVWAPTAGLAMGGHGTQFGFELDGLGELARRAVSLPHIELAGLHFYLGTQIPDAAALTRAFGSSLETAEACAGHVDVDVLDLGGGFPWPFATTATPQDLGPLAPALAALDRGRERTAAADLWFESGRYVAASSGTLLATVVDVRRSADRTFVVLDTGVAQLGGMSGLGRVLSPSVSLLPMPTRDEDTMVADVVGPLCTPLDCLGFGIVVPRVRPGDLVAVPNVGAYGATASLTGFLSRPPAVEVAVRGGRIIAAARLRSGHQPVPSNSREVQGAQPVTV